MALDSPQTNGWWGRPLWAEIDLDALAYNVASLKGQAGPGGRAAAPPLGGGGRRRGGPPPAASSSWSSRPRSTRWRWPAPWRARPTRPAFARPPPRRGGPGPPPPAPRRGGGAP